MIWFVTRQICILMYYWYKSCKSSPSLSPPSSLPYFDEKLSEWIVWLANHPFYNQNSWMMKYPKYLLDCCPLVKSANDKSEIMNRLSHLSPVQAFTFLLLRRLAETVAQLVTSWVLTWIIILLISALFSCFALKRNNSKNLNGTQRNISISFNLNYIWLPLFLLLLSFLTFYIHDTVFDISHSQIATGTSATLFDKMPWKNKLDSRDPPAILDFFRFSSLYQELYGDDKHYKIGNSGNEQFCYLAKMFLPRLSVLTILTLVYGIAVVPLYAFVWLSLKYMFSRFYSKSSSPKFASCDKGDFALEKAKEKVSNLVGLESGDGIGIEKNYLKFHPPKAAVKPRYVSRGVRACLGHGENFQNERFHFS